MVIKVSEKVIKEKADKNEKVYLSDLVRSGDMKFSDLHNTVFNKSVTGIGGTSLALDSDENIIILMPFREVVNNKEGYNPNTFTVKAGVTIPQITKYLKTSKIRKIVSTYDGLPKIIEAYKKAKIDISKDFLLIDEWQVMFGQYIFRNPVMRFVLSNIKNFEKVCLMTATPIKKEWWFKEIQHLDELSLEYDLPLVKVRHFRCKSIKDETVAIIKHHTGEKNLHFFCNSVNFIKDVIKAGDIQQQDIRIICSKDSKKNELKLKGYKIESTKDAVKPINFYTSTCFEGCDIYDANGKIYVLCDGNKTHTLVDISTTLPQIAGRIRDIKDSTIDLIYSSSRYIDVTEEEFAEAVIANKKRASELLVDCNNYIDVLDISKLNCYYLNVESHKEMDIIRGVEKEVIDKVEYDESLLNLDHYYFSLNNTYSLKANLLNELSTVENFIPITLEKPWADRLEEVEQEKVNKMTFKQQVEMYIELISKPYAIIPEFSKIVVDAVKLLGIERIMQLNYHKGDVEKALVSISNVSDENKVYRLLQKHGLSTGVTKSNVEIKKLLSEIYSQLNIKKVATATQIDKYYDVIQTKINVEGKRVGGYKIVRPKVIFN